MNVLVAVLATAVITTGVIWLIAFVRLQRNRPPEYAQLTDLVPGLGEPEEDPEVAHNERLFESGEVGHLIATSAGQALFLHPTIHCYFSQPMGSGTLPRSRDHGYRLAAKRRDMRFPLCPRCVFEAADES